MEINIYNKHLNIDSKDVYNCDNNSTLREWRENLRNQIDKIIVSIKLTDPNNKKRIRNLDLSKFLIHKLIRQIELRLAKLNDIRKDSNDRKLVNILKKMVTEEQWEMALKKLMYEDPNN